MLQPALGGLITYATSADCLGSRRLKKFSANILNLG